MDRILRLSAATHRLAIQPSQVVDKMNSCPRNLISMSISFAKKLLNVGGNSKRIALPSRYRGWQHVLLDIDPSLEPDIVGDARQLFQLPGSGYDAVYCSHNLEHYHRHDAIKVVRGFLHVLKADGFAHIRVPDMGEVMRVVVQRNLDIDDFLYQSSVGPITVRDVIYGFGIEIERSGNDFFSHKTGFTEKSLRALLSSCGFSYIHTTCANLEIAAFAFARAPDASAEKLLRLPPSNQTTALT
jgi:SAM-dependent methyltransferase